MSDDIWYREYLSVTAQLDTATRERYDYKKRAFDAEACVVKLREALLEARPYVPEHHGPIMHKIDAVLEETKGGLG
jgi:hypothetical protein